MADYNTCIFRKVTKEENDETLSSVLLAPLLGLQMGGSFEHIRVSPLQEKEDAIYTLYRNIFQPDDGISWSEVEWGFTGKEQRGYKTYIHRVTRIADLFESNRLARLMLGEKSLADRVKYNYRNLFGHGDIYDVKRYLADPEHSRLKFLGERLPPKGVFYYDKDNRIFKKVEDF